MFSVPIPVDVRSTAWICTLSLFGAAGSMPPVTWMSLSLSPSLVNVLPYLFFPWTSIAKAEAWAELWFMSNCSVLPLSYARHMPSNMAQLALHAYIIYIYIYIGSFVSPLQDLQAPVPTSLLPHGDICVHSIADCADYRYSLCWMSKQLECVNVVCDLETWKLVVCYQLCKTEWCMRVHVRKGKSASLVTC